MPDTPILLLHLTDPHLFAERDAVMRGAVTGETLARVLAHARATHWPPAAILATGDLAQDESRGGYEHLREVLEGLGVAVHCLPGNHDNPALMRSLLDEPPFSYCRTLQAGNWSVIMLDSHLPGQARGRIAQAELARLDSELTAHASRNALVCLHHHPVASGSRWLDTVALENPADLFAVLARHENARALLWGHTHQVFRGRHAGIDLYSTPSTCRQFLPRSAEFRMDSRGPAYRWLVLEPGGEIRTEVEWLPAAVHAGPDHS